MNDIDRTARELEKEIVKKGSIEAYQDYSIAYLEDQQFGSFYKMAKIMADKYDYVPAYYDVFSTILDRKNNYHTEDVYSLEGLSEKEKQEAIHYLKVGVKKGNTQCKWIVKKYIKEKRYFSKEDMP